MATLRLTSWPQETVEPTEAHRDRPTSGRVECAICGKTYVFTAIVVDQVRRMPQSFDVMAHEVAIGRCRLYCDHCNKVIQWRAEVFEGRPTRNVFGAHAVIADRRSVRRFLTEHPEAAGVSQS